MSLEYVLQVFNEEQMGNWCERIYNKDSEYKYILPLTEGVTTSSGTSYYNYLYALQEAVMRTVLIPFRTVSPFWIVSM